MSSSWVVSARRSRAWISNSILVALLKEIIIVSLIFSFGVFSYRVLPAYHGVVYRGFCAARVTYPKRHNSALISWDICGRQNKTPFLIAIHLSCCVGANSIRVRLCKNACYKKVMRSRHCSPQWRLFPSVSFVPKEISSRDSFLTFFEYFSFVS